MRVLFAFILGIVVTVAATFIRDAAYAPPATPFVNWDAVRDSSRGAVDSARAQWDRLTK
jgi:hypothetical protein